MRFMIRFAVALALMVFSSFALSQPFSVLILTGSHGNKAKVQILQDFAKPYGLQIKSQAASQLDDPLQAKTLFSSFDLVLFDAASKRRTLSTFSAYIPLLKTLADTKFIAVKSPLDDSLTRGVSGEQAQKIADYYNHGGELNFKHLAQYLDGLLSGRPDNVMPPILFPASGIYHPDYSQLVFSDAKQYFDWQKSKNTVINNPVRIGLMMQRSLIESMQTEVVDATIRNLEERGVQVLPFYFELSPQGSEFVSLLQENKVTVVDTIINFRSIHWANQRKQEFEQLGVPVVQALTYFDGDQSAWEQSQQGISAGMMAFTLVLPETAGVIDPVIVAAVNQDTHRAQVIDYQLEYLIERVLNYARLRHTPNSQKKLALLFWGDRDMGASFLNVPRSIAKISRRLQEEGYRVSAQEEAYFVDAVDQILHPFYREYELDHLLEKDLADLLSVDEYLNWLQQQPPSVATEIDAFWGSAQDNFMVIEKGGENYFVIPRMRLGNLLIMRQPPRGDDADQDKALYHKATVPMNHYYLAAYYYARKHSNAFIHLGTHGSQEYLPGKERGLSRYDGGNLSIGTHPVMYPFIVDDVGEAMQTKRRGSAVVVSHMTPPYASAGLQGVSADLHELMHQYKALDNGGVKVKTGRQIIDLCFSENLCDDIGWSSAAINSDFEGFLEALHDYLGELSRENQPLGLHTFGVLPDQEKLISTLIQMLGSDFVDVASVVEESLYHQHEHHQHDHDHDQEHSHDHDHHNEESLEADHNHHYQAGEDLQSLVGFKVIRDFIVSTDIDAKARLLNALSKSQSEQLQEYLQLGKKYHDNLQQIAELDHLIAGLNGKYIPVKTGGDPIRHPDSLPTGTNLYGFDPSRLPTKAAYAQGKELVSEMINTYYQKHQRYPDKLAFSLWSIEAMRHYGVLESQALYAMGVEPVWSDDGRVIDTKIIPYSDLKRPRMDVVLSATGLYRDAFPSVMQWMAKAIQQVAQLQEDNNPIWFNSQRIKKQLLAEGVDLDSAETLSTVRIFSNASGDYGSGVDGPVFASDTWESDDDIADNYLQRMGHYFGADDSQWGKQYSGLYGRHLSGTDVALFSRSSNLYGMITSDDPFEYFGSLAMAVRHLDGESPEMMISNLRDAKNGHLESAAKFMAKELRTRNFNKRWIAEMQKEGYSGAVSLASHLDNFWGWQVVDPNVVRDDQWQAFFEVYVQDKLELGLDEWFESVNPKSQAHMIERMLEAVRKEYWEAPVQVQTQLIERYQELLQQYDLILDNDKLREFIQQQASGYGLNIQLPGVESPATVKATTEPTQTVQGQQLEKVEPTENPTDEIPLTWWMLLGCVAVVVLGMLHQWRMPSKAYSDMVSA